MRKRIEGIREVRSGRAGKIRRKKDGGGEIGGGCVLPNPPENVNK